MALLPAPEFHMFRFNTHPSNLKKDACRLEAHMAHELTDEQEACMFGITLKMKESSSLSHARCRRNSTTQCRPPYAVLAMANKLCFAASTWSVHSEMKTTMIVWSTVLISPAYQVVTLLCHGNKLPSWRELRFYVDGRRAHFNVHILNCWFYMRSVFTAFHVHMSYKT
eukprot:6489862-Amphidinium_carterae.1